MALTNVQLLSLGFKPSIRGRGGLGKTKRHDSLVLPINDTDFLYTGYNPFKKEINYKTIWKSFKNYEGERISYQVINLSETGLGELKEYIERTKRISNRILQDNMDTDPYSSGMAIAKLYKVDAEEINDRENS